MADDPQHTGYPRLTASDLQDPGLFRINSIFAFIYDKLVGLDRVSSKPVFDDRVKTTLKDSGFVPTKPGDGGVGTVEGPTEATFGVESGSNLTVATDVTNHVDVQVSGTPVEIVANQKDWPDPATDSIADVLKRTPPGSWASVLPTGNANKVVIPASSDLPVVISNFASGVEFLDGDQLRMDVIQGTLSGFQCKIRWGPLA